MISIHLSFSQEALPVRQLWKFTVHFEDRVASIESRSAGYRCTINFHAAIYFRVWVRTAYLICHKIHHVNLFTIIGHISHHVTISLTESVEEARGLFGANGDSRSFE